MIPIYCSGYNAGSGGRSFSSNLFSHTFSLNVENLDELLLERFPKIENTEELNADQHSRLGILVDMIKQNFPASFRIEVCYFINGGKDMVEIMLNRAEEGFTIYKVEDEGIYPHMRRLRSMIEEKKIDLQYTLKFL